MHDNDRPKQHHHHGANHFDHYPTTDNHRPTGDHDHDGWHHHHGYRTTIIHDYNAPGHINIDSATRGQHIHHYAIYDDYDDYALGPADHDHHHDDWCDHNHDGPICNQHNEPSFIDGTTI